MSFSLQTVAGKHRGEYLNVLGVAVVKIRLNLHHCM